MSRFRAVRLKVDSETRHHQQQQQQQQQQESCSDDSKSFVVASWSFGTVSCADGEPVGRTQPKKKKETKKKPLISSSVSLAHPKCRQVG